MKVPLSWLREYVDVTAAPQELADRLTFAGMEIEASPPSGRTTPARGRGDPRGHAASGADRLVLCQVFDGTQEHRVVCGAHNFTVGDKVPFAGIGTRLPNRPAIKAAKIRARRRPACSARRTNWASRTIIAAC